MRHSKKSILLILAVFVLASFLIIPMKSYASSPKISAKTTAVKVGGAKKLKLKNAKGKIKWTSSKKSIATVSSDGKVKAKKSGIATITAIYNKKKYKCKVYVYTEEQKELADNIGGFADKLKYPESLQISLIWKVYYKANDEWENMLNSITGDDDNWDIIWEVNYRAKNSYQRMVSEKVYFTAEGLSTDWDELYDDIEKGYYEDYDESDLVSSTYQEIVEYLVKEYIQEMYY